MVERSTTKNGKLEPAARQPKMHFQGFAWTRRAGPASAGIVAILPRGETIRNFVHSGTLDFLQQQADLTVVSVLPSPDIHSSLVRKFRRVVPLEETPDPYVVNGLRDILDMAHGRQLWSQAARERWRLRDSEAAAAGRRGRRLAQKIACYPFANRYGLRLLELIERAASRALEPTDKYRRLYRELRPALVFNGSHIHSRIAIHAVQAAQWANIPTAAFVFSWDNLTSQGRVIPLYDYYLVWNEDIKKQLMDIYPFVRSERIFVTGTPQFDFHFKPDAHTSRDEFCAQIGVDPRRRLVLYSTGMAGAFTAEPVIVERIADMLNSMDDVGKPQLIVRVYPKDRSGRFDELRKRRLDISFPPATWVDSWLTPTEEDTRLYTNMLKHVDAGINVASTVSLELCMFDKPVINVGYDPPGVVVRVPYARYYEYDHYRPLVESGAVQLARSESQMRAMLREALSDPGTHRAERHALLAKMFGDTLDGRSAERVALVLLDLAKGGSANV